MKAVIWFRISSVLIALFAAGHTFGFRKTEPAWGLDAALSSLRSIRFVTQGFDRSYWDFYVGFGLFVSVFLALAAILAWQIGGAPASSASIVRPFAWALTASFGLVAFLSWRFFFAAPVIFSLLIFGCLLAGTLSLQRTM